MTLKNKRAPLLRNIKHCASYHHHMWIKTGVTVRKQLSGVMTSVTLTFDLDLLPPLLCYFNLCKTFQRHWWFKTGVTVRKRSIRLKICDFLSRVTLKFDRWPKKTIGHLFPGPLLCYFKIWASFYSHLWSQTGVTVWKISIWVKLEHFLVLWPWNLMNDLEKQ